MNNTGQENTFQSAMANLISEIHRTAVEHGFWDGDRNDGECIALCHSELSEALEAMRHGWPKDEHLPEYDNATVELADCIIRICDFAGARKLNLADAIVAKMEFNKGRPRKHGKLF